MPFHALEFHPPVIAHRGASLFAPENTVAAFHIAHASGARWIQAEVKLTADGMPILMNDDTLDRTTDGKGLVADTSWADVQKLDAGKWFSPAFAGTRVAALAELLAFALAKGMQVNLELKPCPGRSQATTMVSLIESVKFWPDKAPPPLISSADIDTLIIAAQLHPGWPRAFLLDAWRADWREIVGLARASSIIINADLFASEHGGEIRQANLPLLAYTVNDPDHAATLLRSGVTALISDDPALLCKT